ncbi:MAG: MarR family transcriptional regulator [Chloroflexi bacterium]|nr:MarR family transcriptional regulator [Chloroflexota bacterium]
MAGLAHSPLEAAALIMDVVPLVMRRMRKEMRSRRMSGLSLPQFRTLIFLRRHEGASLSQVAAHVGVGLPSMSKIIESLVRRDLVTRVTSASDRRCVNLSLSNPGLATVEEARRETEARVAELLAELSHQQRAEVYGAMQALQAAFDGAEPLSKTPRGAAHANH